MLDFDQLSALLNENSLRLSRTWKGVSDTSSSALKRPLLLSGAALKRQSAENEARVHAFIFESRQAPPPASASVVRDLLFRIADLTNESLLPAGRFRIWPIGAGAHAKVPPEQVEAATDAFCHAVFVRWDELAADPVPLAAWAEWELNGGSLHPFYDGCGRISRSFAAALLLDAGSLPPLYDSFDSYFAHGNQGLDAFAAYVRTGSARAAEWLAAGVATASFRAP